MPSMFVLFIRALLREMVLRKTSVVVAFSAISLLVLAGGLFLPRNFESQATIYADEQNIIKPLLEGQAAVTDVDRSQQAKEIIQTRRVMEMIARQAGLITGRESPGDVEMELAKLRSKLQIIGLSSGSSERKGSNYIRLVYNDSDAGRTFKVMSAVVDVFIRDSSESKRRESKEAYEFIDGQVRTYKSQLMQAEEKLKRFNTDNQDGSSDASKQRISELMAEIETMKLDINDAKTRKTVLEQQISREGPYLNQHMRSDTLQLQLQEAQRQLELLRATYTDTHPDVVSLRYKIEDMRKSMASDRGASGRGEGDATANPVYAELRTRQADVEAELQSKERRLISTQGLLEQEYSRAKRIAERQAELSELTRDYTVTKEIYENLLERKEKARISMTLDVEGQGVTYRIQESPTYPTMPKGLRFIHFVLAGPVLGMLVPLVALVAFIQLDPRVRFPQPLERHTGVPVVAVVPHVTTPFAKRMMRSDMVVLSLVVVAVIVVYLAIAVSRMLEVI